MNQWPYHAEDDPKERKGIFEPFDVILIGMFCVMTFYKNLLYPQDIIIEIVVEGTNAHKKRNNLKK
jgi:hypothetical protein